MKTYSTIEIARINSIHPNTVRFYEKVGFITAPERRSNGYRIFTDIHIWQIRLIKLALRAEILQNGLRKQAVNIIRSCAKKDFSQASKQSDEYILMIINEISHAKEAIISVESIISDISPFQQMSLRKTEAAEYLNITADTLRNWDRNGLIDVKRKDNNYRVYDKNDLQILSIIRTLRCANYSLSSILRLITAIKNKTCKNIENILNTPLADEEIISACDKLITSLELTLSDAYKISNMIKNINL